MGFTAINSSSPAPQTSRDATDSTPASRDAAFQEQQATVASAYLGRGTQDFLAASSKPAPKKAANRGKKRATTAPDQAISKRRKTSNVADAMPAAKPRGKAKKPPPGVADGKDHASAGYPALQHEQALKSATSNTRGSEFAKQSTSGIPDPTSASSLISVIAPYTSMSSFQSTPQQTSVEALKSSSGHGTLLYNKFASRAKQHDLRFSQPLLQREQVELQPKFNSSCGAGLHDLSQPNDNDFSDDDEDFGVLFNQLAQQIEGNRTSDGAVADANPRRVTRSTTKEARRPPTPIATSPADDDDNCFDDDDELAEAMALAAQIDTVCQPAKQACHTGEQMPTPVNSDANDFCFTTRTETKPGRADDDALMIDIDNEDEEMTELDKALKEAEKAGFKPRPRKQNMRNVGQHEDYGGGLLDELEKQFLEEIKLKSVAQNAGPTPIVRSPFPAPILDRSPIFGATNATLLRTCFRLGEALNVGSQAVRCNRLVLLELYARVVSSFRDGRLQHFIFRDLYHDRPPHLEGDFALWDQSRLWDLDGRAFLKAEKNSEGLMCRVIAKMRRDGTKWRLEVLNIWEAGWEDVEAVAGIHSRDGGVLGVNDD